MTYGFILRRRRTPAPCCSEGSVQYLSFASDMAQIDGLVVHPIGLPVPEYTEGNVKEVLPLVISVTTSKS